MSHFTVMVINTDGKQNIEQDLSPYYGGIEVPKYSKGPVSKENWMKFKKYYTNKDRPDSKQNKKLSDQELYELHGEDWNGNQWEFNNGDWEEFSTYNPKSKWDWYVVGGRWEGFLKLLDGREVNAALIKEVDWAKMMAESRVAGEKSWQKIADVVGVDENGRILQPARPWKDVMDNKITREEWSEQAVVKKFATIDNLGYFASVTDYAFTKKEYSNNSANNAITTYAVLLDGQWISKGEMLWFAISSESEEEARVWSDSFYEEFIKPNPNAMVTIVDCHI